MVLAAVAAVVVVGVLAVERTTDDASEDTSEDTERAVAVVAQEADVRASCDSWMSSSSNGEETDDTWCDDMFAWMDLASGSATSGSPTGSPGASMMWDGPQQMRAACGEWAAEERFGSSAADGQCQAMIGWMEDHMQQEGGRWMMGGGMMDDDGMMGGR